MKIKGFVYPITLPITSINESETKSSQKNRQCRVIVLGDEGCGKSTLLTSYVEDSYTRINMPTIGVDCLWKSQEVNRDNEEVKLIFWDCSGNRVFNSLVKTFLRLADAALIVFDVANKESFQNCSYWYSMLNSSTKLEDGQIVLVGLLLDPTKERTVTDEEINRYCKETGLVCFEANPQNKETLFVPFYHLSLFACSSV